MSQTNRRQENREMHTFVCELRESTVNSSNLKRNERHVLKASYWTKSELSVMTYKAQKKREYMFKTKQTYI